MAKRLFRTSDDILELAQGKFKETGLEQMGINLKVMSIVKQKTPLKISRANATTEYLTKSDDVVCLYVYEDVFDRLTDAYKERLMEGILSNVSYDGEKDKLVVDSDPINEIIRMRRKYADYLDAVEASKIIIEELVEEEKARRQAEREGKKNSKIKNKL